MSWRVISIDNTLLEEANNLAFLPNWVLATLLLKSTQILEIWAYEYIMKIWLLLSRLQKSQFATVLKNLKFWQLWLCAEM